MEKACNKMKTYLSKKLPKIKFCYFLIISADFGLQAVRKILLAESYLNSLYRGMKEVTLSGRIELSISVIYLVNILCI